MKKQFCKKLVFIKKLIKLNKANTLLNEYCLVIVFKNKLNNRFDKNDQFHIVRMKDSFVHQSHLCLTFELLSLNLYELINLRLKYKLFLLFNHNLIEIF